MGQVQRLYRDQQMDDAEREEQVKEGAAHRREEIGKLVRGRLAALRQQVEAMRAQGNRLNRSQLLHLQRLRRSLGALRVYTRHVLGVTGE